MRHFDHFLAINGLDRFDFMEGRTWIIIHANIGRNGRLYKPRFYAEVR